MIRYFCLVLLAGGSTSLTASCAGAGAAPREEGPLDRLVTKSNAYTSFHLRAEITDGKQAVPIEMAFKAPDRALLRYGTVATTIFSGGSSHHFLRGSYHSLNYAEAVAELGKRYPGLPIGSAPQPVFSLGDGVRALLSVGRLGARLGWLDELRLYKAEGNVYRLGQTEILLREDGFIARTSIAGHGFVLKDVAINTALPDSLFALPSTQGLQDNTARLRKDLLRGLDEVYHRWILKTSTADDVLETLIRIDFARKYEPEKMAAIQQESLKKSMAAFHVLRPDAKPEVIREKLLIEQGKAMGAIEIMEEEILKDSEKALDGYFRGMSVIPPQKEMLDVARRWQAAVKRQVDEQIRRRIEAIFDAAQPKKE